MAVFARYIIAIEKGYPMDTEEPKRPQIDRFREAARELGCEDSTAASDALVGRMAKMPPKPHTKPEKRPMKPKTDG